MNNNLVKNNIASTKFFNSTPTHVKKDTLLTLINEAYLECSSNEEEDYLNSKFNSYKKNPKETEWYGFFCELVYRHWLKDILKPTGRVIFAQKKDNDLKIITESMSYSVEVKAIQDNPFNKIKNETRRIIERIPTGKFLSIELRDDFNSTSPSGRVAAFQNACNELVNVIRKDSKSDTWDIKEIGKSKHNSKTDIVGFTEAYFSDNEHLKLTINNHLIEKGSVRKQIKAADIICFYLIGIKFDAEDVIQVLESLPGDFDEKIFGYFTKWQDGKPGFFSKKKHTDKVLRTILKG